MAWWGRVLCRIGKHRYYVIKKFSPYAWKVGCTRCSKTWAMNHDLHAFLPWDQDFEDLYSGKPTP